MKPRATLAAFLSAATRLLCATLILAIAPHSFGKQLNPSKIVVFGASQESKCSDEQLDPVPTGISECYMFIAPDLPPEYPLWPNLLAEYMGAELANYARAGAWSDTESYPLSPPVMGLKEQVENYLEDQLESGDDIAEAVHLISANVNDPTVNGGMIDELAKDKYIENMKNIVQALEAAGARHIFYMDYRTSGRIALYYYIANTPFVDREGLLGFIDGPPGCTKAESEAKDEDELQGEDRLDCSDDILTPLYKQMSDDTWDAISEISSVVKRAPVAGFLREIEDNMAFYGFQPDLYGFCYRPLGPLFCLKEDVYGFSEINDGEGDGDPTQLVFEDAVHWGPRTYAIFAVIMQDLIRNSLNAKYHKKDKGKAESQSLNFKRAYVRGRLQ